MRKILGIQNENDDSDRIVNIKINQNSKLKKHTITDEPKKSLRKTKTEDLLQ